MLGLIKIVPFVAGTALLVSLTACSNKSTNTAGTDTDSSEPSPQGEATVLARTMTRLDGSDQDLADYEGKVILIVNVASKCGLTPQYKGLQSLYEGKQGQGFVVLGFPANNFGGQEPGSDAEITQFCTENYGVTFPMFSKISVTGDDQHALFSELSAQTEDPNWNFTKYLIDRDGQLVARFDPRTKPDDEALVTQIDELLGAG